jgi:hypothetical protein
MCSGFLNSCSTVLLLDLGRFFSFLILYSVGRTPWMGDQPVARSLPTHRTTQTQNKCTQTFMQQVGLEPTIPAFERAKTVHALERAFTVIAKFMQISSIMLTNNTVFTTQNNEKIIRVQLRCKEGVPLHYLWKKNFIYVKLFYHRLWLFSYNIRKKKVMCKSFIQNP